MQSELLIQTLSEETKQIIIQVEKLKTFDLDLLKWRAHQDSWSILECLAHLNLYGDFYLPQIEHNIKNSTTKSETEFKNGFLGNYFAKSMLPKDKINKMKTFKNKNPLNVNLDTTVIDKFLAQEIKLLNLLNQSRYVSLNKVKIQTSISSLLSLKLGDTFQFYTNHIVRHLKQIDRINESYKKV